MFLRFEAFGIQPVGATLAVARGLAPLPAAPTIGRRNTPHQAYKKWKKRMTNPRPPVYTKDNYNTRKTHEGR